MVAAPLSVARRGTDKHTQDTDNFESFSLGELRTRRCLMPGKKEKITWLAKLPSEMFWHAMNFAFREKCANCRNWRNCATPICTVWARLCWKDENDCHAKKDVRVKNTTFKSDWRSERLRRRHGHCGSDWEMCLKMTSISWLGYLINSGKQAGDSLQLHLSQRRADYSSRCFWCRENLVPLRADEHPGYMGCYLDIFKWDCVCETVADI